MAMPTRGIKVKSDLLEVIRVGLIQTDVDMDVAWNGISRMRTTEAEKSWFEIRRGFRQFLDSDSPPNVVLIPELSVPKRYLEELRHYSRLLNAVVIAGLDYKIDRSRKTVANEAAVIIPQNPGGTKK